MWLLRGFFLAIMVGRLILPGGFMSVNRGVAPPDFESDVGQVRAILGDTVWVPLDPVESGFGSYVKFSDGELGVYLERAGSVEGAVAVAFMQMASAAAEEAKAVKDYDIAVDLTKRSSELRQIARMWQSRVDRVDGDFFELVDVRVDAPVRGVPELSPFPFGRL